LSVVLDASLTLAWYFEDERTPAADQVLDRVTETGAVVPALWRLEVANGLQVAVRRKRCDAAFRDRAIAELSCLPISLDAETNSFAWTTMLHLADRFKLSLYDACYLELAQRQRVPLGSLDDQLCVAATRLGVEVLGGTK
jgi:predicted nucleic acid-binding protein